MKKAKSKKPFGWMFTLDLKDCKAKGVLNNKRACERFLNKLVRLVKMDKQAPPFVVRTDGEQFDGKDGFSGYVPLAQSHATVLTMTKDGFVSVDLFSCMRFNREKVRRFVKKWFKPGNKPGDVEENFLERGKNYIQRKKEGEK